jgi:serine/threonine-protein kinase
MSFAGGTRIGSYEVVSAIGKGGMGEVYRARDTRLDRDVAIKTLPEEFAADPDRLARFEREAKLLASLNHPNIAAIYGLERFEGRHFLVLELVDGETLADHIARGPIPVDESLRLAVQIAEALQAAHEKGVIHRDLKPANIKLTHDGAVKVLDFGLAKATEIESTAGDALSNSPTLKTLASTPGMILGTAAYMSPEQAKGRPVDRRTDIFAFGCVLYEMLTGKRAFAGEDISDTLAAVLRAEPEWTTLPADVPHGLRTLIQCCLAKDRARRVADISAAKLVLSEPALIGNAATSKVTPTAPPRSGWKTSFLTVASILIAAVAGGVSVWMLRPSAVAPAVMAVLYTPPGWADIFESANRKYRHFTRRHTTRLRRVGQCKCPLALQPVIVRLRREGDSRQRN